MRGLRMFRLGLRDEGIEQLSRRLRFGKARQGFGARVLRGLGKRIVQNALQARSFGSESTGVGLDRIYIASRRSGP